jgi:MFS family permease
VGLTLFGIESAQGGHSVVDRGGWNRIVPMERPAPCARPWRKRKQVQVAERQLSHKIERLSEFRICLAGKTNHDIRAQGKIRPRGRHYRTHLLHVVPGAVAPMHPSEDRIGTRLQRQVDMPRKALSSKLPHQADQILIPVHGLDGTKPQARQIRVAEDLPDQSRQRGPQFVPWDWQVASPSAQVDARQHQFLAARGHKAQGLSQHSSRRQAPRRSSRLRNHAKRTAVPAPFLNLQVGSSLRTGHKLRFFEKRVCKPVVSPDRRRAVTAGKQQRVNRQQIAGTWRGHRRPRAPSQTERDLGGQRLVAVAHDRSHSAQASQFFRSTLRITARHQNPCLGIQPMGAPDEGAGSAVGLRCDAACIHHHNIGQRRMLLPQARRPQPLSYSLPIGAGGAAAKVFDVEGHAHGFSVRAAAIARFAARTRARKSPPIYWSLSILLRRFIPHRLNEAASEGAPAWNGPGETLVAVPVDIWQILTFTYFTFICYLSIGLPLAILPAYVHLRMGFSAVLAGLVISIQYIATFLSRPWAGRISDRAGAKVSVLWGMGACTASGFLLLAAVALHFSPWLSFLSLIASRLALGVGESLGSTGAALWGINSAGPENTAKIIGFNGISTYSALALGAPLGVVMEQHWGLTSIGLLTIVICGASLAIAARKDPVAVEPGKHLPFRDVLGRVAPHGMGLALGGVGYSVLATFVTLFYASRHWNGAALCLTAFGVAFIAARLLFIRTIDRFGGFPVSIVCLSVESVGVLLLWSAHSPWMAFAGAALTGFGNSLVFPALGVEAVQRVSLENRGTALSVYTVFADVSFFMVGPVAGAVIGGFGYRSVFLFALFCVLAAIGIASVLLLRAKKVS